MNRDLFSLSSLFKISLSFFLLKFSLPTPKGGKHPNYPQLSEDQPMAHNFPAKKAIVKNDPLDPDYVYQASPFATKDVHSRAARLGINPNKFNSRFMKRK